MDEKTIRVIKKRVITLIVLVFLFIILDWLFTHSFIEVSLSSAANGQTTYELRSQGSLKTTTITSGKTTIKRLVRKGNYEVVAHQGENSYFSVVKTNGFLKTSAVQAQLSPEKNRQFIGNNPGACMRMVGATLISYDCTDAFVNTLVHIPATAAQPTFAQKINTDISGTIESFITLQDSNILLIRPPAGDNATSSPHIAYQLDNKLQHSTGIPLPSLDPNKQYTLLAYKSGFIAYDNTYQQVLYFANLNSKPITITTKKPASSSLIPYYLSVNGEAIIVIYSNNTKNETAPADQPNSKKIKSEVVLTQNNQSRHFDFQGQPAMARTCDNQLCLVSNQRLEVYNISHDKPENLFSVTGVNSIEDSKSGILLVRDKEILELSVEKRIGYVQYSLGNYEFCGIQTDAKGYIVCIVNKLDKKAALRIDPSQTNTDSIDKKIGALLELPEIKDLSAYGRFIYISPQLGPLVYDAKRQINTYDPLIKKNVNSRINQEIDKLGIDRNKYKITNPYDY